MGIWDQLNTKTIADKAATEIQAQSNPVHLQESNRSELSDIQLINNANLRSDGGIIPDTIQAFGSTFTDNGTAAILTPEKGEVWQIIAPVARVLSGSVTTTLNFELRLGVSELSLDSNLIRMTFYASTSSSPILTEDTSWDGDLWLIGHGQKLHAQLSQFSATEIFFGVLAGRVR